MTAEQLLATVPLFEGLDRKHLSRLAKTVHERSYTAGDVIVRQGEGGIGMFIVSSGRVEIVQDRQGQEHRLRTMGEGETFGELALLTDHPRTATVRAVEPTTCLILTSWNFRSALDESPEISQHLVGRLAQWLVQAEDRSLTG
jgi:CRP-like cAMP-binding protein